jgi:hypothetical protein
MRVARLAVAMVALAGLMGGCATGLEVDGPATNGTPTPSVAPSAPSVAPSATTPTAPPTQHGTATDLPYPSGAPKTPSDLLPSGATGGTR